VTEISSKEQNKYREFKGMIKQAGAVDEDTLYSTVKNLQRVNKMTIFAGVLLLILGVPLSLFVIGIPMVIMGIVFIFVGAKRKARWGRFATAYARDDLGVNLSF
jgi:hypothetical protein